MAVPRIMVGGGVATSNSGSRSSYSALVNASFSLLGLLGFALFVVGGVDFLLNFYPLRFGNPEWEFGTITGALNAIPSSLVGLVLLLVSAVIHESAIRMRALAVVLLAWAAFLLAMGVIYGLTLPLAARGFADPGVGLGLKRAIFRSALQLAVYPAVMIWLAVRGFRQASTISV